MRYWLFLVLLAGVVSPAFAQNSTATGGDPASATLIPGAATASSSTSSTAGSSSTGASPTGSATQPGTATLVPQSATGAPPATGSAPTPVPTPIPGTAPAGTSGSATGSVPGSAPSSSLPASASPTLQVQPVIQQPSTTFQPAQSTTAPPSWQNVPAQPQAHPGRGGSLLSQPLAAPPAATGVKQQSESEYVVEDELVVTSDSLQQAKQHRQLLSGYGLKIKRRKVLKGLGLVISVYRVPAQTDVQALIEQVQLIMPNQQLELNQKYYLQAGQGVEYAKDHVRWPSSHDGMGLIIAMLDAAVDSSHGVFKGANLQYYDASETKAEPTNHGTSVASLLVGQGEPVLGAVPKAKLIAVNVFKKGKKKLETRTDWILVGLDYLASQPQPPRVVNMSFGGRKSAVIEKAINRLSRIMLFVAAAGNSGADSPVMFPANMKNVVAVTGVDTRNRVYSQASRGDEVLLAAPGVDVWVAGLNGGYYASGTSYASPWVAAAMLIQPSLDLQQILSKCKDLGEQGVDPVFGYGLLQLQ